MFQDITGATQHLRHAKGLDQMITVSKSGLPIDISKVRNTHPSVDFQALLHESGIVRVKLVKCEEEKVERCKHGVLKKTKPPLCARRDFTFVCVSLLRLAPLSIFNYFYF